MSYGSLYVAENLIDGRLYIGQTIRQIEQRWSGHKSAARNGSDLAISKALREYGDDAFVCEVAGWAETPDELDDLERLIIRLTKSNSPEHGFNTHHGGGGKHAASTRIKMSASHRGHEVSEVTKHKIRETSKRRKMPDHVKEILRSANKGQPSHKRKAVICIETGAIYPSLKLAAKAINGQSSSICNQIKYGKPRTTKGFTFAYAEQGGLNVD
jgi:group I intron endonuclease